MSFLWTKTLLYDNTQSAYWGTQTFDSGTTKTPHAPSEIRGSIFTVAFSRLAPTGLTEDIAEYSYHLGVDAGPGAPSAPLSATQAASVETAYNSQWNTLIGPLVHPDFTLKEYQWRDYGADFPLGTTGLSKPGPVWRVTAKGSAGTGSGVRVADQNACSVTFRTSSRKHWGRIYLTGLGHSAWGATGKGRLVSTYVDGMATAHELFFNALAALPAVTNVWVWSQKYRGLLSLSEVHVDDVSDVIRSRRPKYVAYRKSFTS